jgi:hypothetical protein
MSVSRDLIKEMKWNEMKWNEMKWGATRSRKQTKNNKQDSSIYIIYIHICVGTSNRSVVLIIVVVVVVVVEIILDHTTTNTKWLHPQHQHLTAPTQPPNNRAKVTNNQQHQQPTAPTQPTTNKQHACQLQLTDSTKATGSTNDSTKGQDQGHQKPTAPTTDTTNNTTKQQNKATDNWQHQQLTALTPPPNDSTNATDNGQHQRTEPRPPTTNSTYTTDSTNASVLLSCTLMDLENKYLLKIMSNNSHKDRQQRRWTTTKDKPSASNSVDQEMSNINNYIKQWQQWQRTTMIMITNNDINNTVYLLWSSNCNDNNLPWTIVELYPNNANNMWKV